MKRNDDRNIDARQRAMTSSFDKGASALALLVAIVLAPRVPAGWFGELVGETYGSAWQSPAQFLFSAVVGVAIFYFARGGLLWLLLALSATVVARFAFPL